MNQESAFKHNDKGGSLVFLAFSFVGWIINAC